MKKLYIFIGVAFFVNNGQKTSMGYDPVAGEWVEIGADTTTKAWYVSGVGAAVCSGLEYDVVTIAANATASVSTATASQWFVVTTRLTNPDVVYFLPSSTDPSATTGIELLQSDSYSIPAQATVVTFYNADAVLQATASVLWCY